jgi:glycosyltransferase involved in cell wall biosynthesis
MKIAIVTTSVPFIRGGAEILADSLKRKLEEFGYQASLIGIPFQWNPPQKVLEHMLACQLLRFENIDRIIGLKFPAYAIKHPDKVLWLLHQFRQIYDLWGTPFQEIPSTPEGLTTREAIIQSDNRYFREARKIFTISGVVSQRLMKFNDFSSEVLYPPLLDDKQYSCSEYGNYMLYVSRITMGKRQHLALQAMKYVKSNVRLIIAGSPDTEEQRTYIKSIIEKENLADRVVFIDRFISEEEKLRLYAEALACIFIPYDEDYGYITLESYRSKKAVITCSDSGGPLWLVKDGDTGYVVPPAPEAIAEAMDKLFCDKKGSQKMGEAGFDRLLSLKITWENVIKRLTE